VQLVGTPKDIKVCTIYPNIYFEDLQKIMGAEGQKLDTLARLYIND